MDAIDRLSDHIPPARPGGLLLLADEKLCAICHRRPSASDGLCAACEAVLR